MIWFLPLLAKAAAVIFASGMAMAIIDDLVVAIDKIISRLSVSEVMKSQSLNDVLIETVNRTSNKVTLRDLNNDDVWEIRGTDVDYDIRKGVRITV